MSTTPAFPIAFFSPYGRAELRELITAGIAEEARRKACDIESVRAEIQSTADRLGLTMAELVGPARQPAIKVPAQYRNPANASEEWSGRGRAPRWVTEAEARGASRHSLRIPS